MDDWIDYYDSTHTIYVSKLHRDLHFQIIARDIIGYIASPDATVLDYACGEALSAGQVANACGKLILAEPGGELDATLDPDYEPGPSPLAARIATAADKIAAGDVEGGLTFFFDAIEGPGAWARLPATRTSQGPPAQRIVPVPSAVRSVCQPGGSSVIFSPSTRTARPAHRTLTRSGPTSPKTWTSAAESPRASGGTAVRGSLTTTRSSSRRTTRSAALRGGERPAAPSIRARSASARASVPSSA